MDGGTFSLATEGLWKARVLGRRDACIPPFKTPSMDVSMLHHEDVMRDGYHPKMLLFMLDELFYIYAQIKKSQRVDEKIVIAYEILYLSMNWCTDQQHGLEKTGVPNTLALLNVDDARHLECLVWAVYDGALLVGPWAKLPGDCPWCMVLAGLHKHIYRAAMMWPIAHHTRWAPGTARSGLRCCREGVDPALHEAGGHEHPGPRGGPKAACDATLRHRSRGIGRDTPKNHHAYAFKISPWSDHTPLYTFEVLL